VRTLFPRRILLLLPLLVAACASEPPPTNFAPLRYEYLTPLRLNVGQIDVDDRWRPMSAADVGPLSPVPPVQALAQMARDRLKPAGSTARAVFTIDDASIIQNGDQLLGSLAAHVDIVSAEGARVGYAEARVARNKVGLGRAAQLPAALYDITKQMMEAMNVELEYQIRRNLKDWLVAETPSGADAGPVQAQDLPAPGTTPDATPGLAPTAPPMTAPPISAMPAPAPFSTMPAPAPFSTMPAPAPFSTMPAPAPMPPPVPVPSPSMSPPAGYLTLPR